MKTLDQLLADSDWGYVFCEKDCSGSSISNKTDPCPPGANIDLTPPTRADVAEILLLHDSSDQEWDGWSGTGLFKLKDGRYLVAQGSCDYTGWG
jgi:hypothetical protein